MLRSKPRRPHLRHLNRNGQAKKRTRVNADGIVRNVVVMGASAGGVEVLGRIISELSPGLSALLAVVLHRGPMASRLLEVLGRRASLPLVEPRNDMPLEFGMICLAPPDHHMELQSTRIVIRRGPKEHSTRPAIDPLFRSAALWFKTRVAAVLLTGCGDDGVNGMVAVKENGGICLVQDPAEAAMPYMPMNAIRYDHVDAILPVKAIASTVNRLVRGEVVEC